MSFAPPTRSPIGQFVRNLPEQTEAWRGALRADGFAAVLAQYSDLRQLAVAAPDTAGNWTIIDLPGEHSASSGGIHFGDAPIGAIFADAAQQRPSELAEPTRRIAVEQFTSAINRVQTGDESPEVAWSEVLWRIEQFLG